MTQNMAVEFGCGCYEDSVIEQCEYSKWGEWYEEKHKYEKDEMVCDRGCYAMSAFGSFMGVSVTKDIAGISG